MSYATLGSYRGWEVRWDPREYKLCVRKDGLFLGSSKYFDERPRDRVTAFELAKAWIDRG